MVQQAYVDVVYLGADLDRLEAARHAEFHIYRHGMLRYTETLGLHEVGGEWRIMTKMFASYRSPFLTRSATR